MVAVVVLQRCGAKLKYGVPIPRLMYEICSISKEGVLTAIREYSQSDTEQ